MDSQPTERRLGDYRLKEIIAHGPVSVTWLAEQVSVKRPVLIEEMDATKDEAREEFIADLRAKATVDQPLIAAIYEAGIEDDHCFCAHEFLTGQTLEQLRESHGLLPAARLAPLLRRIAEANMYLENRQLATSRLSLSAIHFDERVTRLENLALAGQRFPSQSQIDIQFLGTALPALVAAAHPGTTTFLQVLRWMRGEETEHLLTWQDVHHYCEQIEHKLGGPVEEVPFRQRLSAKIRQHILPICSITTTLLILIGFAIALKLNPPPPPPPPRVPLAADMLIPAQELEEKSGEITQVPAFTIAGHAVTIGEYKEFLAALQILTKTGQERTFDHPSQPPEKTGHFPKDWADLAAAAKANGTWNARPVSIDSPVVGVDWWDAVAYAEWKQARLPSDLEWKVAMQIKLEDVVSEWAGVASTDADQPVFILELPRRKPGDSPTKPLEPTKLQATSDRSLRRDDLGFRIVTTAE